MTDKKTEELNEQQLDQVTGGATEELFGSYNVAGKAGGSTKAHDHLTDHNWQLEIEGVTTGAAKAPGDVVIKGKKILQN